MEWGFRPWLLTLPMPPRARALLMRAFGAEVGADVRVHPLRVINADWRNLTIERDCYVGADVLLDLVDQLTIRRGAVLAARVAVHTHQDAGSSHQSPTADRIGTVHRATVVGSYAFLGTGAIVLAGCSIGDEAVVGAGAVVTRPVPPRITVVGSPARPIELATDPEAMSPDPKAPMAAN